ncbi:MAG: CDP-diacylglycerol--glycerol-3-phosphate 3-phosphatidyltransferase [Pseudomonadota bacterium]
MAGLAPRDIPNIITILRIVLVVPTTWFLWESKYVEAFYLMLVAGVSDALDGYLARRFKWQSNLGATLDPLADKLLVAAVFVVFTFQGHIPLWVAIIVLLRDTTIIAGAGVYKLLYEEVHIAPTMISKINTTLQIVTLLLVLFSLLPAGVLSEIAAALTDPWCFYLLAILGVGSGLDYIFTWGSKAYREGKKRKRYRSLRELQELRRAADLPRKRDAS